MLAQRRSSEQFADPTLLADPGEASYVAVALAAFVARTRARRRARPWTAHAPLVQTLLVVGTFAFAFALARVLRPATTDDAHLGADRTVRSLFFASSATVLEHSPDASYREPGVFHGSGSSGEGEGHT